MATLFCRADQISRACVVVGLSTFLIFNATSAPGGTFEYGTLMGTEVTFIDVTEHSVTDTGPLYGSPTTLAPPAPVFPCALIDNCTIPGNTLDFTPVGFAAFSQDGGTPDTTDGQLVFMAESKPGFAIHDITFFEAGITTVVGNGTDATYTDVGTAGTLNIQEVDGVGIDVIAVPIDLGFFRDFTLTTQYGPVSGDGTWRRVTDGVANTEPWFGHQFIDVDQALMDAGMSFTLGATKISVNLDNGLLAQSEMGTNALIDKKDFFIVIINIPEPASGVLAMLGAVAGVALARRRSHL